VFGGWHFDEIFMTSRGQRLNRSMFRDSVRTAQQTHPPQLYVKTVMLMLYREQIAVRSANHAEHTLCAEPRTFELYSSWYIL
jgi:hypothetical protein